MDHPQSIIDHLVKHRDRDRLVDTAFLLIDAPSPTGQAGKACDRLAEILEADGFEVERPDGGHPAAPAVVVRFETGKPGRTLQFNGHLDTVHLPFVPARVEDDLLRGSGASDMKGGVAAAVEALRMLRDSKALTAGSILLTAHDLHEAPWGDGRQLDRLIREGIVGDAVLLPEPLSDVLPTDGRGCATWKVRISRTGPPVHEVMRPMDEPSVIAAGAELVARLKRWDAKLAEIVHSICGSASVFIGQIHSGEIYNQYPQECRLEGTRRWLPGTDGRATETEFRTLLADLARESGTRIECDWLFIRDAFHLDQADPFVSIFQASYQQISNRRIPLGGKPFVDDGNSFWALAGVPAITHGPRAGGQHTVAEWADIADMERVALLYALTAVAYCASGRAQTEDEEWPQPAPYPI
ncbi:M20 family metallopeptidase [Paludisphaera borealis]|uniref:5-nitroanthranilic acid aminohydrolase n=1 Tax=Paludisphaera borealis TaxID=1387353 RepID=A0A1U7CW52_9BACT|nr:M20/M25/M40 family metallo-hydrolase [Paludisphaera borealis]APW63151.1 5-nitroanthranilic acid aminohydrolase [Paludisphaera borealis]